MIFSRCEFSPTIRERKDSYLKIKKRGAKVAKKRDIPEQNVRIYKDALKVAYSDGSLSEDGELMLKSLRGRYEVDEELDEELKMEVFAYLAELHKEEGDVEEALKWFKALTDIDEDDEYAWRQMGIIYTEKNEYQMAGRTLKRAHQISERAKKDLTYAEKIEKKADFYKEMQKEREETVKKRSTRKRKGKKKKRPKKVKVEEEVPELIEDVEIVMEDSFEMIEEEEPPSMDFEELPPEEEFEEVSGADWGDDEDEEEKEEVEDVVEEDEEEEEERPRRRREERRRRREPAPPEEDEEEKEEERPRRRREERRKRREPAPPEEDGEKEEEEEKEERPRRRREDRRRHRDPAPPAEEEKEEERPRRRREDKRRRPERPTAEKKEPAKGEKKDSMKCPKCGSQVEIPSKKRPIIVKCGDCGASGKLMK